MTLTANRRSLMAGLGMLPLLGAASASTAASAAALAPKPPLGWNSWNSFATSINEAQALESARFMAVMLTPHG
jgi:hypothetical protein